MMLKQYSKFIYTVLCLGLYQISFAQYSCPEKADVLQALNTPQGQVNQVTLRLSASDLASCSNFSASQVMVETYTFPYKSTMFDAINSECVIIYESNEGIPFLTPPPSSVTWIGTPNGTCNYVMGIYTGGMLVPVELIHFSAQLFSKTVELQWITATEFDNAYFEVEKSVDAQKFKTIGKVLGTGTSVEEKKYIFIDEVLSEPIHYYRLKQVDLDGAFEYSAVIAVSIKEKGLDTKIYPSPTATFLNIEANEAINTVEIIDLTGRIVLNKIYNGVPITKLDVANLIVGTYFIRIQAETGTELLRFVKN